MNLSVCIDAVYKVADSDAERLDAVRRSGYRAYEFWGWWNRDIDALERAQKKNDLILAALCTRFIPLTDAERHSDYIFALRETLSLARRLGCDTIISQVGAALDGVETSVMHESIVNGLKQAVPIVSEYGMTLVIEPLNTLVNHPGYYLSSSHEAAEIIDEVDSPCVRMLFDIYHQQISEGNVTENILRYMSKIGHFHIAGNPGRKTPLGGEIDYRYVLGVIQRAGYSRYVGLEYFKEDNDNFEDAELESRAVFDAFAPIAQAG